MQNYLVWILQTVILGAGIYFFLRFLRTTRGSGLVRGLVVTLLFGLIVLLGMTRLLQLEELDYIVQKVMGYTVVILAILFQPELRRGMAQLGEHPLMGRFLARRRQETLNEVVQAANAMSGRRHGALIAFEREFSLDPFIETAVKLDSEVNRLLLETIFHPGGPLHDGAVVIQKDRVAGATCLFPLTENVEIAKSTGTRHRAALGLTEETDAVALVVSEETGKISICKRGKMIRGIASGKLEDELRRALGSEDESRPTKVKKKKEEEGFPVVRGMVSLFTRDVPRKLAALALAWGLLYLAYQDIMVEHTQPLRIVVETPDKPQSIRPNTLVVRLPASDYHLEEPQPGEYYDIKAKGTRGELTRLGRLRGVLVVKQDSALSGEFPLDDVSWSYLGGAGEVALNISWEKDTAPNLRIDRIGRKRINLSREHLEIDTLALNERFEVDETDLRFDPQTIIVGGPQGKIGALDESEDLRFRLQPLRLTADDTSEVRESLNIEKSLADQGFFIEGAPTVTVRLGILPSERALSPIDIDIAVVSLDPSKSSERYELTAAYKRANFRIMTRGIVKSDDAAPQDFPELSYQVRNYVKDKLRAYVDVGEVPVGGGGEVPVRWTGIENWRADLQSNLHFRNLDERADLWVELVSNSKVLLTTR